MKHSIEEIREALSLMVRNGKQLWGSLADDAIAKVEGAVVELAALRSHENDGHYPTRAELHAQLDAHAKEKAALLLRVAELEDERSGAAAEVAECIMFIKSLQEWHWFWDAGMVGQKRKAESRATQNAVKIGDFLRSSGRGAAVVTELDALRSQVTTLTQRLEKLSTPAAGLAESGPYTLADVALIEANRGRPYGRLRETVVALDAAKADAARAELRAKELKEALENSCTSSSDQCKECVWDTPDELHLCPAHAALEEPNNPDSDERLREVMLKVAERAHDVIWNADEPVLKSEMSDVVNEVLGKLS